MLNIDFRSPDSQWQIIHCWEYCVRQRRRIHKNAAWNCPHSHRQFVLRGKARTKDVFDHGYAPHCRSRRVGGSMQPPPRPISPSLVDSDLCEPILSGTYLAVQPMLTQAAFRHFPTRRDVHRREMEIATRISYGFDAVRTALQSLNQWPTCTRYRTSWTPCTPRSSILHTLLDRLACVHVRGECTRHRSHCSRASSRCVCMTFTSCSHSATTRMF